MPRRTCKAFRLVNGGVKVGLLCVRYILHVIRNVFILKTIQNVSMYKEPFTRAHWELAIRPDIK